MRAKLEKAGRAVLAALASKQAVAIERKLAVLVAVRVAVAFGAGAGVLELIQKLG